MFLNECLPIDDIRVYDIGNIPYFVIPMYDLDTEIPPFVEGKNYQDEYLKSLDEHHRLTKILQELLLEREKLTNSLQETEVDSEFVFAKRPKSYGELNRKRRKAKDITRFFNCEVCGKSYGSEGSLKQHTKIKHLN